MNLVIFLTFAVFKVLDNLVPMLAHSLTHSLTHSLIVLLNIMLLASHKMVVTENEDALLSTNLPECARAFAATI